jgi:predicted nucleic acid-binding protein
MLACPGSPAGTTLLYPLYVIYFLSLSALLKIHRHIDKIRQHSGLNNDDLFELISLVESRIFFIDEELLPTSIITAAHAWVSGVDCDDFAFVAIAAHLDAWLWTGDKKLINGLRQNRTKRVHFKLSRYATSCRHSERSEESPLPQHPSVVATW